MKRMLKRILVVLLVLILLAVAGFGVLYAGRLRTVNSIKQITAYDDYNLYRMDVTYDYSIDDVINYGITDNQSMIDAILKETLPLLPIHMKAPQFGCSAFATVQDRHIVMGRNYDFKRDTSAMLVYCTPKDGYKSVALAALDVIFNFPSWLFILILLGGIGALFYPLAHWMHEKEGKWWPWPKHKKKK